LVSTHSGGNQQRFVLARELAGSPSLLVAVNPTRGLGVAAMEGIPQRLRDAARADAAVLYYTADLDELIEIADRIVTVFEGRVREVARNRDVVGRAMLGAA
jgi:simple sugar transport system ATP-binding protein